MLVLGIVLTVLPGSGNADAAPRPPAAASPLTSWWQRIGEADTANVLNDVQHVEANPSSQSMWLISLSNSLHASGVDIPPALDGNATVNAYGGAMGQLYSAAVDLNHGDHADAWALMRPALTTISQVTGQLGS